MKQPEMNDRKLELLISDVLRFGLVVASLLMIAGGCLHLWRAQIDESYLRHFHSEPEALRTIPGIIQLALAGKSTGLMQLGVLLLIATPIARVIFAALGFALEKDWKFVLISLVVLTMLLYGLVAGTVSG